MGRKKIAPPQQTLQIGDRVKFCESHNWGGLTGVIHSAQLGGSGGSDQFWVYRVKTHEKFVNENLSTKTRFSIRAYKQALILLKRK